MSSLVVFPVNSIGQPPWKKATFTLVFKPCILVIEANYAIASVGIFIRNS
ncbi:MAG: hypothetical protein AAFO04_08815 [Cyanobacteria bacterium J06592_8]